VLEAGCGVGAQTMALARRSPDAAFVSIDISTTSLAAARRAVDLARLDNVEFQQADILDLPFTTASFDLSSSASCSSISPTQRARARSAGARAAIQCQVALQAKAGNGSRVGTSSGRNLPMYWSADVD
jgi:SAM-dependent methyltransferase